MWAHDQPPVSALRVTTAAEAAARDQAAIEAGTASFELMLQAGTTAAAVILRDYAAQLADGVALFAGSGNNGGDAYIVAAQLSRAGVTVRLHAAALPQTPDAIRASQLATPALVHGAPTGRERVVVDGLLGTGHRGALREPALAACRSMLLARGGGASIVALDLPTGVDATTGHVADGSVAAHTTLCFGTIKRGALLARGHVGRIVLLDIGLAAAADRDDGAWHVAGALDVARMVPPMAWNAHKGTRGRVAIVGGQEGMAGAVVLATRAALAAGAGVAHAMVDGPSVLALQLSIPQALAEAWPEQPTDDVASLHRYSALAIGPGLGRSARSSQMLEHIVKDSGAQPLVLDADALWLVAQLAEARGTDAAGLLAAWTGHARAMVCTPHEGEFARLLGGAVPPSWDDRAEALRAFAARSGATVLLKGTPTLIATPQQRHISVVPHGTPLLATGGSGDMLTGVIVALLGQGLATREAAVCAATVHGVAAELATARLGGVRGATLNDVFASIPLAWRACEHPAAYPPGILLELPCPV